MLVITARPPLHPVRHQSARSAHDDDAGPFENVRQLVKLPGNETDVPPSDDSLHTPLILNEAEPNEYTAK